MPPPKTTIASPAGKVVFAAKACRTVSVELLFECVRIVQPEMLIPPLVELTNSMNSSCAESRVPSWLASPSVPVGGSASTSLTTTVGAVTLRVAMPLIFCEAALIVNCPWLIALARPV